MEAVFHIKRRIFFTAEDQRRRTLSRDQEAARKKCIRGITARGERKVPYDRSNTKLIGTEHETDGNNIKPAERSFLKYGSLKIRYHKSMRKGYFFKKTFYSQDILSVIMKILLILTLMKTRNISSSLKPPRKLTVSCRT